MSQGYLIFYWKCRGNLSAISNYPLLSAISNYPWMDACTNKQYKIIGAPHRSMHVFLQNWNVHENEHQAGIENIMWRCRNAPTHASNNSQDLGEILGTKLCSNVFFIMWTYIVNNLSSLFELIYSVLGVSKVRRLHELSLEMI